jgi:hypothetical protein
LSCAATRKCALAFSSLSLLNLRDAAFGRPSPAIKGYHYEVCEIWFYTAADTTTKDEQMTRRSIEERLAQLEAQRKTLQARLGKQERARDTRRKVLLGALVLNRLEKSDDGEFSKRLGDWLRRELPGFLTRDDDKLLFSDILEIEKQDV